MVPCSGTASSRRRKSWWRSVVGAGVSACGTEPPTMTAKAVLRGHDWMKASATFLASSKLRTPSEVMVMDDEPSITIAMSRAPERDVRA